MASEFRIFVKPCGMTLSVPAFLAPTSKVAGDSLDLPITVAGGVKPTAPGMFGRAVSDLAIDFGTTRLSLRQGAFRRWRKLFGGARQLRRIRSRHVGH
jgi:hypothetical protein